MDDIIESGVQNEEKNDNSAILKELQENNILNQINFESNFEKDKLIENKSEIEEQNEFLKNSENTDEHTEKVPSSDSLSEIKSSLFLDVRYYTIKCADPSVKINLFFDFF